MDDCIYIPDEGIFQLEHIYIPESFRPYIGGVLVTQGLIKDRIMKMSEDIFKHFGEQPIVCLVVLRGAFRFAKDLIDMMEELQRNSMRKVDLEFIRAKSYQGTDRKELKIEGLDGLHLEGKNVLIIEDLVDSGVTLSQLVEKLQDLRPADLKVAALIFKRNPENTLFKPDFLGFSLPNEWIIGYHIDYNDYFRDLKHVCYLNQEGKDHFREV